MIRSLPPLSLQSTKLQECIEIASRIAKCEPDPQTVRATVMYCLERNVDGFPVSTAAMRKYASAEVQANLFSNNRDFIDSIDVDDMPVDDFTGSSSGSRLSRPTSVMSASTSASTPSLASFGSSVSSTQMPISPHSNHPGSNAGLSPLHCTLFLFDDKLMIVKRQNSSISGKKVTGLDNVPKLVKSGGGVAVMDKNGGKKDKLSYRGVVNVSEVTVTDVGNGGELLWCTWLSCPKADRQTSNCSSSVHPLIKANDGPLALIGHTRLFSPLSVQQWIPSPSDATNCVSYKISGLLRLKLAQKFCRKKWM